MQLLLPSFAHVVFYGSISVLHRKRFQYLESSNTSEKLIKELKLFLSSSRFYDVFGVALRLSIVSLLRHVDLGSGKGEEGDTVWLETKVAPIVSKYLYSYASTNMRNAGWSQKKHCSLQTDVQFQTTGF